MQINYNGTILNADDEILNKWKTKMNATDQEAIKLINAYLDDHYGRHIYVENKGKSKIEDEIIRGFLMDLSFIGL